MLTNLKWLKKRYNEIIHEHLGRLHDSNAGITSDTGSQGEIFHVLILDVLPQQFCVCAEKWIKTWNLFSRSLSMRMKIQFLMHEQSRFSHCSSLSSAATRVEGIEGWSQGFRLKGFTRDLSGGRDIHEWCRVVNVIAVGLSCKGVECWTRQWMSAKSFECETTSRGPSTSVYITADPTPLHINLTFFPPNNSQFNGFVGCRWSLLA